MIDLMEEVEGAEREAAVVAEGGDAVGDDDMWFWVSSPSFTH